MKKAEILSLLKSVDPTDPQPIYSQIIRLISLALAAGNLQPGDRLPSTRDLARALKINLNTSARTYRDMAAQGLIVARRGVGMFIADEAPGRGKEKARKAIDGSLRKSVTEARKMGLTDKEIMLRVQGFLAEYGQDGHDGVF
ncbi:MAG: GntR family transcriptional regulator [Candidatus Hydrogenedens sp.]|nr:GntR family transcriptional regulator [Candidatus Hydrogenedens sp.]